MLSQELPEKSFLEIYLKKECKSGAKICKETDKVLILHCFWGVAPIGPIAQLVRAPDS